MNKKVAFELSAKAAEVAEKFSNLNRNRNFNNETFKVSRIVPLGEILAYVIFQKSNLKKALAVFYYIEGMKYWQYFFPKEGHLIEAGWEAIRLAKIQIEKYNYPLNWRKENESN